MSKEYEIVENELQGVAESVSEFETSQHLYVKDTLHRGFQNMHKAEASDEQEQDLESFLDEL